jgi:hypothetical protein
LQNLKVWTEVLQDSFLDLFDSGNLDFATATSIRFSPGGFKRFYDGWENYHSKLLLRSQQVSNSPEIIRRLGVIGMNTPVRILQPLLEGTADKMNRLRLISMRTPTAPVSWVAVCSTVWVDLPTFCGAPNIQSCIRHPQDRARPTRRV